MGSLVRNFLGILNLGTRIYDKIDYTLKGTLRGNRGVWLWHIYLFKKLMY